jgi:hypothetical protein
MGIFSSVSLSRTLKGIRAGLAHAFAVPSGQEVVAPEDLALLDRVADAIHRRGMAAPTVMFLESMAPMNFLGSQALHFMNPIIDLALSANEVEQVARLLERRDTISRLTTLIEAKSVVQEVSVR